MSSYKIWAVFEREIVKKLSLLGFESKRNWDRQFLEKSGVDVIAQKGDKRLLIQCKYGQKPNIRQAYLEALDSKEKKEDIPVAIVRFKKERDTLVCLSFSDFLKLLKELNERRREEEK